MTTITIDRAVVEQLLSTLEEVTTYTSSPAWSPSMTRDCENAIITIQEALKEPERPWVGLTHEEVIEISHLALTRVQAVQMTEAKLKEKNTT
jgi:hypothetical protein